MVTKEEDIEVVKVVARFRNGAVIKGFTRNFFANKDVFHISPPEDPYGEGRGISMKDLKAVYFVRDFNGNPRYDERKRYGDEDTPSGRRVEIKFSDGETQIGSTLAYGRDRMGFFFKPADPQSNNIRVFAISSSVEKVRRL